MQFIYYNACVCVKFIDIFDLIGVFRFVDVLINCAFIGTF